MTSARSALAALADILHHTSSRVSSIGLVLTHFERAGETTLGFTERRRTCARRERRKREG